MYPFSAAESLERQRNLLLLPTADPTVSLIIGGDFNGRAENLDNRTKTALPTGLAASRRSKDIVSINNGILLLDAEYSSVLLNGRAEESSGDYTYYGKGLTVIDYVFVSWSIIEEVHELFVLNIPLSDHSPAGLIIGREPEAISCQKNPRKRAFGVHNPQAVPKAWDSQS